MNVNTQKNLIVIVGPTGIGKTAMAIQLAQHLNTEIISADARQFYKEMNIGTAKPTLTELSQAKHHFINNLSVTDEYNAGKYEHEALGCLTKLFTTHQNVIMVGGSGLFIKAVCDGFDEIPEIDPNIRLSLIKLFEENGLEPLLQKLEAADFDYFQQVDKSNTQRVMRALEVCIGTGMPFSSFRKAKKAIRDFNIIKIGLTIERARLYERINQRVDNMIEAGLVEEVKSLLHFRDLNALQTVGYSEIFDYFDGKSTLDKAIVLIKQNTRHYAKRQLTWFNKDADIQWFEPNQFSLTLNPSPNGEGLLDLNSYTNN